MKKSLPIILICTILLQLILPTQISLATLSNSDELISLGTGNYKITVTTTTTVEKIIKILGEPKLKTDSAFGGYAYTFYTDTDYNNFLYIETTSDGQIISYGSIDPTYETNTYSYGDKYVYTENGLLYGCLFNNNSVVEGGVYYNKQIMTSSKMIKLYETNYLSDEIKYLKGLAKQGIEMYNALSTRLGNKTNLVFNEEFFYINEQLKENGTSMRTYFGEVGKASTCIKAIGIRESVEINNYYYILNPMQFASLAKDNKTTEFGEKNIAIFDYNYETKILYGIGVKPDAFAPENEVSLTSDEMNKLSAGRYEYAKAIENLYAEDGLYKVEPQSTVASELVAGELKDSKKQGIVDYVNAIRVAAGLPKLEINEDAFLVAQHISTLTSYRVTELGEPIAHVPPQPDGVSNEFYKTAIAWGRGYAENLGYSATASTESTMMYYMNLFLSDSSENPQNFSHRSKVLDPNYTYFGFGISPYTFSNEFGGYADSNVYLEAWPSNGITFLESLESTNFKWTAQFLDKYKIQDATTVTVKCLNTGKTWNFTDEEKTGTRQFTRVTDAILSLNNKVIFYDSTIIPEEGNVYQITLHNLLNESTEENEDYTYRTVFEYADIEAHPSEISSLSITVPETIEKDLDGVYLIPVGEEVKLTAVMDEDAVDKKITWISSNDSLDIKQNGTICVLEDIDDDIIVTVYSDNSNAQAKVVLRTVLDIPADSLSIESNSTEITISTDNKSLDINYNEYNKKAFSLTTVFSPENTTISKEVEWTVGDTSILESDGEGNFTIKKAGITTITAKAVNGMTDTITVKITATLKNLTLSGNTNQNIGTTSIKEKLTVVRDPDINADTLKFTSSNTNIATVDSSGTVTFLSPGTVIIKATSEQNSAISSQFTYNVKRLIDSAKFDETTKTIVKGESFKKNLIVTPSNNSYSGNITYTSSDTNVATVKDDGTVTGLNTGTTTITAKIPSSYTSTGKDITISYTIEVKEIQYTLGDVNADGKINTLDAIMVLQHISHKITLNDTQKLAADTSKEGNINTLDVIKILQYISHKITQF